MSRLVVEQGEWGALSAHCEVQLERSKPHVNVPHAAVGLRPAPLHHGAAPNNLCTKNGLPRFSQWSISFFSLWSLWSRGGGPTMVYGHLMFPWGSGPPKFPFKYKPGREA